MSPHTDTESEACTHTVVIPHFNDVDRLDRCLAALARQDLTGVEVVVADNASTQPLEPICARYPWVRFVAQPVPGAAEARNAGIAASTAPWLFLLDADCVPSRDWLEQARRVARGPEDLITGGQVTLFDETPPPRSGAEAFETVFAFDQERYINDEGFSVTANLVISRATVAAVGPFRTGLSEDLDWCRRARAAGAALVYDPALRVAHPTRSDWPSLRRKWRRLTEEGFGLVEPGLGTRATWALKGLAMPASVLAHLPRILRHPVLSPAEKLRATATLARLRLLRMVWLLSKAIGG